MIVIATAFIPVSPLYSFSKTIIWESSFSKTIIWESSHWLRKNIVQRTGGKKKQKGIERCTWSRNITEIICGALQKSMFNPYHDMTTFDAHVNFFLFLFFFENDRKRKGNATNQYILLFPQCFLAYERQILCFT